MEHTNEFLRGMFAAYMGCGCEITETQEGITTITKAESSGVVSERVHFAGAGLFVHFSKLKPTLTPLSEITDEDAVEVAKIAIGYGAKSPIKIERKGHTRIFVTMQYGISDTTCVITPPAKGYEHGREFFYVYCQSKTGGHTISNFGTSAITDLLRFKHYDLGYMHIPSLITAGLAIKKTI